MPEVKPPVEPAEENPVVESCVACNGTGLVQGPSKYEQTELCPECEGSGSTGAEDSEAKPNESKEKTLSQMNKDELKAVAKSEKVRVKPGATNKEITEAIRKSRTKGDK